MELAFSKRNIKVIKSVQAPDALTQKEMLYGEYTDGGQVLEILQELELQFEKNPSYEKLHGLKERLSLSYRHKDSKEIISFMTKD